LNYTIGICISNSRYTIKTIKAHIAMFMFSKGKVPTTLVDGIFLQLLNHQKIRKVWVSS